MHEIQWLICDPTIFLSLIYEKVKRWLHVDVYREPAPNRKYDVPGEWTHIIVIVIFEAKKITKENHEN